MPNSEYLRLKQLLQDNPQYKVMLDTISKAEGTWGKNAYSTKFGGKTVDWRKGKDQALLSFGKKGEKTSAHGKYQFINKTWKTLSDSLGMTGFSPEEQDIATLKLLEDNGALKHIDDGKYEEAVFSAGKIWMGLPVNKNGDSGAPGQKAKPLKTVMSYMKSNEAERAKINDDFKKMNEDNVKKLSPDDIVSEKNKYIQDLRNINGKKISEPQKENLKHLLKRQYYRDGKLLAIEQSINEDNKKSIEFENEVKSLFKDVQTFNNVPLEIKRKGYKEKDRKSIIQRYEKLGFKPNDQTFITSDFDLDGLRKQIEKTPNFNKYIPVERGLLKYGKTKDEYDAEVAKNSPEDNGVMPNATTDQTPDEVANKKQAEADQAKIDADLLAQKNKPFKSSDILDKWDEPGMFSDAQFEYTPGKQKIPFDSLIGLTTGLMGAAAADDVNLEARDEQISEGMILYAQDIAKIKNMGLDPAIEGSLKQKLADAYQTGLENIVHASNGNRNLVLGNQGQLDSARMKGIVEIVAMDIDRTDKAMAAFGEVQKYISEFESRKDIANNERKYAEGQQKQVAGMTLAQQGMSNFVDSIAEAKQNAPGSVNDMKRQWFQFQATGILPNAEEGKIGSLSYRKTKEEEHRLFEGKIRTYSDWKNTLNLDDQKLLHNILLKNPQLDPVKNKAKGENETKFEDLEKYFNDVSGNEQMKNDFLEDKGVSSLTIDTIDQNKDAITADVKRRAAITGRMGTESKSQSEIYGDRAPVVGSNSKVPIETKPAPVETIIGKDGLANKTILNQLTLEKNGLPNGPNTINNVENQNDYNLEAKKRGSLLTEKAEEYLSLSQKNNQVLDNITQKAKEDTNSLLTLKK